MVGLEDCQMFPPQMPVFALATVQGEEKGVVGVGASYAGGGGAGGERPLTEQAASGAASGSRSGGQVTVFVYSDSGSLGEAMAKHINTYTEDRGGYLMSSHTQNQPGITAGAHG